MTTLKHPASGRHHAVLRPTLHPAAAAALQPASTVRQHESTTSPLCQSFVMWRRFICSTQADGAPHSHLRPASTALGCQPVCPVTMRAVGDVCFLSVRAPLCCCCCYCCCHPAAAAGCNHMLQAASNHGDPRTEDYDSADQPDFQVSRGHAGCRLVGVVASAGCHSRAEAGGSSRAGAATAQPAGAGAAAATGLLSHRRDKHVWYPFKGSIQRPAKAVAATAAHRCWPHTRQCVIIHWAAAGVV